jgi:ethanolaminephosphotransferase
MRFIPIKWAPNAITLVGFILVIIGTLVIYTRGSLGDVVPETSCFIFAICILTYQNLDNIDGKQARRTNTSSPLGMLFDHGCDAMSCFCLALSLTRMMMITNEKLLLFGLFLGVLLSFYMSVWAQYHSKGIMHLGNTDFNLGKINAVDDGIPLIWILGFITSVTGSTFWSKEAIFGLDRGVCFLNFIFICSICTINLMQSKPCRWSSTLAQTSPRTCGVPCDTSCTYST